MSLLEQIKKRKSTLKPTESIVTRHDGRQFIETKSSSVQMDQKTVGYVIDTKPDNVPAQIIENLFLGSQDCCDISVLDSYRITHVLSVGIEAPTKFPSIEYRFVEMLDLPDTNLIDHISSCVDFIQMAETDNKKVLVHCNAGVSRSASIVIAFLMVEKGLSFKEAYDLVKRARSCIRPNDGFLVQLKSLE